MFCCVSLDSVRTRTVMFPMNAEALPVRGADQEVDVKAGDGFFGMLISLSFSVRVRSTVTLWPRCDSTGDMHMSHVCGVFHTKEQKISNAAPHLTGAVMIQNVATKISFSLFEHH